MQRLNEKIVLAVFILLALSNLIFFIESSHSGPIFGFVAAIAVAIHWKRKRDPLLIIVVAIVWISLHIYELIRAGTGSLPFLFYPNVLLPALLLLWGFKEKMQKNRTSK